MNVFDQVDEQYTSVSLTVEEETALALRAQAGERAATMQLLCNYIPTLKSVVSSVYSRVALTGPNQRAGVDIDDLRSAAVEGFFDALREFTPSSGRGAHRVKLMVLMRVAAARDTYLSIEVPHSMRSKFAQAMRLGNNDLDAGRAHATSVGLLPETYDAIARAYTVSRSASMPDGDADVNGLDGQRGATPYVDEDDMSTLGAPTFLREEDLIDASRALDALPVRERLVIETIYGIGCEPHTDRQAAVTLGIPRTTVQRVVAKALAHMRVALGA